MFYIKLMHIFEKNIKSLGLELPEVPSPVANYLPFKIVGNLMHISGQAPILDGNIKYKGKVAKNTKTLFLDISLDFFYLFWLKIWITLTSTFISDETR